MITAIAHKITAFVLVFILFAHNINTLVIVGDFLVNQDFIAKTLCIQKENQQGCNGKCHLKKQLSESTSDSNNNSPLQESKRMSLDVFCVSHIHIVEVEDVQFQLPQISIAYQNSKLIKAYFDVDTPPPIFS